MGKKENRISFAKDTVILIQALCNLESEECERYIYNIMVGIIIYIKIQSI